MRCVVCGKELTGGLDTFGALGAEMCWADWSGAGDAPELVDQDFWYGLGPHEHTYDEKGQIVIGGTKFKPLPEANEDGLYRIDGLWFWPDPEAPGCGVWFKRRVAAEKRLEKLEQARASLDF